MFENVSKKLIVFLVAAICLLFCFVAGFLCSNNMEGRNDKKNETSVNTTIMSFEENITEENTDEIVKESEITIDKIYDDFSKSLNSIKVGDTIFFGSYEQDNDKNNGKENIEWIVLYKSKKNSMMLISKKILDAMPYSLENENVTWAESDVRKFLNDDFYNAAFDDFSKHFIMKNEMSNNKNVNYKTDAGEDTIDKVFLLSESQANRYFKKSDKNMHNKSRATLATKYAKNRGIDVTNNENEWYNGNSAYWLRTPGSDNSRAIVVEDNGNLFNYGENVTKVEVGIRPCIWIKY